MKKHLLICILGIYISFSSFAQLNYQWVKGVGGAGGDLGKSIVVDDSGYVYVTGLIGLGNLNFNPFGSNAVNVSSIGSTAFLAKYDSVGNCKWAYPFVQGSGGGALATSIAVDTYGSVYLGGVFEGPVDFDLESGTNVLTSVANGDAFLAKYSGNGSLQWIKHFAGADVETVTSIAIDELDSAVYVSGDYQNQSIDFIGSQVDKTLTNSGGKDGFVASYGFGGTFLWANAIGGSGNTTPLSIAANDYYVIVTGSVEDTAIFDQLSTVPDTIVSYGESDVFYAKYILDGSFGWSEQIGGPGSKASGTGIAFKHDTIYLAGVFSGQIDADPSPGTPINLTSNGAQDAFIGQYDIGGALIPNSQQRIGSETMGSSDSVYVSAVSVDNTGNLYLAGIFKGAVDFDPSSNTSIETSSGTGDAFFSKYDNAFQFEWNQRLGGSLQDKGLGITVDGNDNVYVTGAFQDVADFDPADALANRISGGSNDIFIGKYAQGRGTITGVITYGNNATLTGPGNRARLYTQILHDGNDAMHVVKEVDIDPSSGVYIFSNIPAGNYFVLGIPFIDDYLDVSPTYYGDTVHWQGATYINLMPNSTYQADINLKAFLPLSGDAVLGGQITQGDGFDRTVKPVAGTDVGLEGDPENSIIARTVTDENGYYSFEDVPHSECYRIYVHIPGLPVASNYHVCPSSLDTILTLDFTADSNSIDTVPNLSSSIADKNIEVSEMSIYPNPNKGTATVEFNVTHALNVRLCIYNTLGEKVAELMNEKKSAGIVKYLISLEEHNLTHGVYFLNLTVGENTITQKLIYIE